MKVHLWKILISLLFIVFALLYIYNYETAFQPDNPAASSITGESKPKPRFLEPIASRELGVPGKASAKEEFERLWNYVYNRQYDCTQTEYLGGRKRDGDGAYDLCVEKQFWPFPNQENKCLLYSFGVGGDFSFDDAMAKRGCEVHSFDPSIDLKDGSIRESGVVFHNIGIADEDNDNGFRGWKMRTLKTIMKEFGHENRYLDYLKTDTDKPGGSGFEDEVMKQLLDTGLYKCVRQYSMEIHLPVPLANQNNLERCRNVYSLMRKLNDEGWRLFNTTDNVYFRRITNPSYHQLDLKASVLKGGGGAMLWQSSFVNFDVEGPCYPYL